MWTSAPWHRVSEAGEVAVSLSLVAGTFATRAPAAPGRALCCDLATQNANALSVVRSIPAPTTQKVLFVEHYAANVAAYAAVCKELPLSWS